MDDSFDPYLQWLGIRDAERPPNYYRLLGVAQLEGDTDVISNAADRQTAHVRTFQTGKYSDVSQRVLNELAKAKVCLLKADKKAAYDKKLSEKLAAAQAAVAPTKVAEPAAGPLPVAVAAPRVGAGGSGFAGVAVESGPSRPRSMADRAGRSSSKQNNKMLWLTAGLGLLFVGIIAAVVVAVYLGRGSGPSGIAVGKTPSKIESTGKTESEPLTPLPKKTDIPKTVGPRPKVEPAEWPFEQRPQAEPADREAPPVKLTALVLKSLRAARRAMQDRDLDQADQQLKAAATAAKTKVEKDEVNRHRYIQIALRSYWNAVAAGLSTADAGKMLSYRDGQVTIVSMEDGQLKLKAENGAEKSFDIDSKRIDLDLARGLAKDQFDKMGPTGLVAIGAATAMDRRGDIKVAENLWLQAHRQGTPVSHFVNEVRYDFSKLAAEKIEAPPPPGRKPVPSKADQDVAVKEVRNLFRDQIRDVKTVEQALALATKMLNQAEKSANKDPMRYELFAAGIEQLVRAGALEEARGAVDALAKTFEVDRVDRTAAVMISMVNTVVDPKSAMTLVEDMGQFAYEAAVMGKPIAASLIEAAKRRASRLEKNTKHKPLTNHLARFPKFLGALKKLAKDAEDPTGNLLAGEFECYIMDDWERGLKHLAKASDKQLSKLAQDDLASPTDDEAQLALGDRWWEIYNRKPSKTRSKLLERVGVGQRTKHWYEASPGLGKDVNAEVRDRNLKKLAADIKLLGIVPSEGLDLFAGAFKVERGTWERDPRDGARLCKEKIKAEYPAIMFGVRPTGAYRLDIEFERMPSKGWVGYLIVCLPTPGGSCALSVDTFSRGNNHNGVNVGKARFGGTPHLPGAGRHKLIVGVTPYSNGTVKIEASVDGKPIINWSGPIAKLKGAGKGHDVSNPRNIGIGAAGGGIKFYKVNFTGPRAGK
ncbi:MAG: hypothetical protein IIA67_00445 [Planctomycetes bacterium]|nr:hypothetical protein [Planctomycetota bacterium]